MQFPIVTVGVDKEEKRSSSLVPRVLNILRGDTEEPERLIKDFVLGKVAARPQSFIERWIRGSWRWICSRFTVAFSYQMFYETCTIVP